MVPSLTLRARNACLSVRCATLGLTGEASAVLALARKLNLACLASLTPAMRARRATDCGYGENVGKTTSRSNSLRCWDDI